MATYKSDLQKAKKGELKSGELIRIGKIPLYDRLGFSGKPFGLSVNVFKKITKGKHNVKLEDVDNLPVLVADPCGGIQILLRCKQLGSSGGCKR